MEQTLAIDRPETLKDLVYKKVKSMLISGRLESAAVHSANQLADELGVSRTPVREALLQLSAEGFMEPLKGRGFRVRRFGPREIHELFEARRLIEVHIVEHVTLDDTDDLATLEESIKAMRSAGKRADLDAFLEADEVFHFTLLSRYGNRLLGSLLDNLHGCIQLLGSAALRRKGRMAEVCAEHEAIIEALRRGDARAAGQAMRTHLAATEDHVLAAQPRKEA